MKPRRKFRQRKGWIDTKNMVPRFRMTPYALGICAAFSCATAHGQTGSGIDLGELTLAGEIDLSELWQKSGKQTSAKIRNKPPTQVILDRQVQELLQGEEQIVAALAQLSVPSRLQTETVSAASAQVIAAAPAFGAADKHSPPSPKSGTPVVQVVIPEGPLSDDGPSARLLTPGDLAQALGEPPNKQASVVASHTLQRGSTKIQVYPADPPKAGAATQAALGSDLASSGRPAKLIIADDQGQLRFLPKLLQLDGPGATADLQLMAASEEMPSIFVRDITSLRWDAAQRRLTALKSGRTELYAVRGGHMTILPVQVGSASVAASLPALSVPTALTSLDGLVPQTPRLGSLHHDEIQQVVAPQDAGESGPSLHDSMAQTARTMAMQDEKTRRFQVRSETARYRTLTLQLVDERSNPDQGLVYPVVGAEVHVVGTGFSARTDATGHLTIRDVPEQSRFWIIYHDANGQITPGITEVSTHKVGTGVLRLRALRALSRDTYASIIGQPVEAALASACIVVNGEGGTLASGLELSLDVNADGPYYFNSLGYLDPGVHATGSDGRACFFNINPGPVAVRLAADEATLAVLPLAVFAGQHAEFNHSLNSEGVINTYLAAARSAAEQLQADRATANSLVAMDMIDLIPLGDDRPMQQLAPALVSSGDGIPLVGGRAFALARAAEFEPVIYSYQQATAPHVSPLFPRGLFEDLAVYAQVAHDPELGGVLVEYLGRDRGDNGSVNIRLLDHYGREVGDAWYYSDIPTVKAVFFNVPAGAYQLLIETADSYWLGGETVLVYNESISFVPIGGRFEYRP